MTDAGPLQLINHDDADSDDELLPPGIIRFSFRFQGSDLRFQD